MVPPPPDADTDVAVVVDIASVRRAAPAVRSQEQRREFVRTMLLLVSAWLDAGLAGDCSLEEATCSALWVLQVAQNEVLRASLA